MDCCYTTTTYLKACRGGISPMPDKSPWEKAEDSPQVKPPEIKPQIGRPKNKRIKSKNEKLGGHEIRRQHRCKKCGLLGHRMKTCPRKNDSRTSFDPPAPSAEARLKHKVYIFNYIKFFFLSIPLCLIHYPCLHVFVVNNHLGRKEGGQGTQTKLQGEGIRTPCQL